MDLRKELVAVIGASARERVGVLAGELLRAPSEEKEGILAELEFERWLADLSREALLPL